MSKHTDLLGFKVLDENVVRKQIRQVIKEAQCRQKSQELADSYSLEELQSRLDQIMMDMEQEAEPEGGPIADMYADEMDAYEGAIRIAKGGSDKPMTYDDMLKKHYPSKDEFTKSSKFDRGNWEDDFDKKYPSLKEEGNLNEHWLCNDNMSAAVCAQLIDRWNRLRGRLGEGKWIGDSSYKTRVSIEGIGDTEISIDNANTLDNVTIRWRGANHWGNKMFTGLNFEPDTIIDDHGNEGKDIHFTTESEDGNWYFMVEVYVEANYEMSGNIGEVKWDTLEIEELHKEVNEQGFDDRLAKQMGMSDDEFEDKIASRDIESPFPGTDDISPGYTKARDLIEKLRQDYRNMSDEDLDEFSKTMVEHFLDRTAAQAAAKIWFGKRGI